MLFRKTCQLKALFVLPIACLRQLRIWCSQHPWTQGCLCASTNKKSNASGLLCTMMTSEKNFSQAKSATAWTSNYLQNFVVTKLKVTNHSFWTRIPSVSERLKQKTIWTRPSSRLHWRGTTLLRLISYLI